MKLRELVEEAVFDLVGLIPSLDGEKLNFERVEDRSRFGPALVAIHLCSVLEYLNLGQGLAQYALIVLYDGVFLIYLEMGSDLMWVLTFSCMMILRVCKGMILAQKLCYIFGIQTAWCWNESEYALSSWTCPQRFFRIFCKKTAFLLKYNNVNTLKITV